MKLRESGMPQQDYWESLFDVPLILDALNFGPEMRDVAELGCGYGTFSVPLAARIRGVLHALDLDPSMVALTQQRATEAGLTNLHTHVRDVATSGFGVAPGSCDACLLFNILHAEEPVTLLRAAAETVRPGGLVAVIHWRSDVATPRGPSAEIRPRPAQIIAWAATAGLALEGETIALPPWHFGLKLRPV